MSITLYDTLIDELITNPLFKTDTRAIFFLLQNPEPVSADDIAAATGLSCKCANKAIKRLTGAGLIIPGLPEARKRAFDVTGGEPIEPPAVTEKDDQDPLSLLTEKIDRIESILNILLDRPTAGSASAPAPDGIGTGPKVTQAMTIPAPDKTAATIQPGTMPEIGQKGTADESLSLLQDKMEAISIPKGTEQGTNESQKDIINDDLDDAIKYAGARLAVLKATALLKEKAANSSLSSTCAPMSIDAEFQKLFGVHVPPGFTDTAAVETMIARRKAGKLDNVKSPLAYLGSIAGKVQPIVATSRQSNPEIQMPVKPTVGISFSSVNVEPPRLPHADIDRINSLWDAITDKAPYEATALPKFEQQVDKYKIPLHILAKSVFNAEQLKAGGQLG